MPDRPDWSKLSAAISSRASDALNEVKQLKDSMPQQGVELPDIKWSKLSGTIVSRASDALNEVKQLKDSMSQQDHVDLPHVDWSKLSGGILSRASDAWKEVKQLKDPTPQQGVKLPDVDWSKLSGAIVSSASSALNKVGRLKDSISQQNQVDLRHIDWSKLSGGILSRVSYALNKLKQMHLKHPVEVPDIDYSDFSNSPNFWGTAAPGTSKPRGIMVSCGYYVLTGINNWSIRHPYVATGALLCIAANPELLLTPLQLTVHVCLLPLRLIIFSFKALGRFILYYVLGFAREGVAKDTSFIDHRFSSPRKRAIIDSSAPQHQCVLEDKSKLAGSISLLSGTAAVYVFGRTWGWGNMLKCAGALVLLCMLDAKKND